MDLAVLLCPLCGAPPPPSPGEILREVIFNISSSIQKITRSLQHKSSDFLEQLPVAIPSLYDAIRRGSRGHGQGHGHSSTTPDGSAPAQSSLSSYIQKKLRNFERNRKKTLLFISAAIKAAVEDNNNHPVATRRTPTPLTKTVTAPRPEDVAALCALAMMPMADLAAMGLTPDLLRLCEEWA